MRKFASLAVLALGLTGAGCYHAIIDTGLPAGGQTIEQPWAMSFVVGLIPPPVLETASRCPNGVSKVETQHSFLNALVAAVTFSIITPMDIRVTCAARRGAMAPTVPAPISGGPEALTRALRTAIERSTALSQPIYVQITE